MKKTPEERAAAARAWCAAHPEKYAAKLRRQAVVIKRKREEAKAWKANCCQRKTDLIRGKGRLIEQCAKCGAMLDRGPEPECIDWFRPIGGV